MGATNQKTREIPLFRPYVRPETIQAVGDVLRSGWLGIGPRVEEFEQNFAAHVGTSHCVAVNSCTSALHLALHVLDLPPGTEIITTALTFVSTNQVILQQRCQPVFADVNPLTGNICPASIREKITEQTGAIMVVHFGGYPCDLHEIYALAQAHGLPVVEDCAHACGASYRGQMIGTHGHLHAFSFHATKNLTMGDGGALTVSDPAVDRRLRRLRGFGVDKQVYERTQEKRYQWDYNIPELGFKYYMNDINAAIGLSQLRFLEAENAHRRALSERYRAGLAGVPGLQLIPHADDRESSHHLFCVLAENRDDLMQMLHEGGVKTGVHYRRNDDFPIFEKQELPCTEHFWRQVVSLPMFVEMTPDEVDYVTALIRAGW